MKARRRHRSARCILLSLALVVAGTSLAVACNVPVFRYALQRWRSAPYRLTLVHDGALREEERAQVTEWMNQWETSPANLEVRLLDVSELDDEADETLMESLQDVALPALVLQYPREHGNEKPCWTRPWEQDATQHLADSPVRQELARRLASGETAVWLVLQSGHPAKDHAAETLLTHELKRLETELELPELDEEELEDQAAGPPLRVAFSVLTVSRDSKSEEALVATLLHSEADLAERSDPLVFPVFGQGRALWPLVGAGVTPENITNSAAFLVGACSCEVKQQNPGFDLLMAADWESLLKDQGFVATSLETPVGKSTGAPELVPIPTGSTSQYPVAARATGEVLDADEADKNVDRANNIGSWLGGLVAVGVIVAALWWRRK